MLAPDDPNFDKYINSECFSACTVSGSELGVFHVLACLILGVNSMGWCFATCSQTGEVTAVKRSGPDHKLRPPRLSGYARVLDWRVNERLRGMVERAG